MQTSSQRRSVFAARAAWERVHAADQRWGIATVIVALFGLATVLAFCLRASTLSPTYGTVPAELPLIGIPPEDPGFHGFAEHPQQMLTRSTPTVVLTTEAFYFGDLEAFTTEFSDVRRKFIVRHVEGEPQLERLIDTMQQWLGERAVNDNIPRMRSMILLPTGDIPMPIVIQVVAGLRRSPFFERVVLGTGLL